MSINFFNYTVQSEAVLERLINGVGTRREIYEQILRFGETDLKDTDARWRLNNKLYQLVLDKNNVQKNNAQQSMAAQPPPPAAPPTGVAQQTTGALSPTDVEQAKVELKTYGLSALDMIELFPPNDPIRGTKMLAELQRLKASHTVCCRVMLATGALCILFANNLYSANAANAIDNVDQTVSFVRCSSKCMTCLFTLASVASCCQSYCTWHNKTLFLVLILVIVFSLSMNT